MTITIKPRPDATRRTKNRVAENGNTFTVRKHLPMDFNGVEAVLLDAVDTDWFGWLPSSEIEILSVKLFDEKKT